MFFYIHKHLNGRDEYQVWSDGWDTDEYEILTPTEFAAFKRVQLHHAGIEEYDPSKYPMRPPEYKGLTLG